MVVDCTALFEPGLMNMGITVARSFADAQRNSEKPIASLLGAGIVPQIKY